VKQKKKTDSNKKWVLLIILPFVALILTAIAQTLVHFTLNQNDTSYVASSNSLIVTLVNILSVLIGIASVILIILMPVWIIMLVRNNETGTRSKTVAVLLAVFLSFFSWLYTYEKDATKFWVNLGLTVVSLGLWSFIAWIWAIVDTASKPETFYKNYK
jgi:hypothetical protein